MARRIAKGDGNQLSDALPLPLPPETWDQVAESLALSPQQKRIVELLLRGMRDQQIALELNLGVPTVRTYLGRIFVRTGARDRMELVLRVFTESQRFCRCNCHQL